MNKTETFAGVPGSRPGSVEIINESGGTAGTFTVGDEIVNVTNAGNKCFVTAKARGRNGVRVGEIYDLKNGSAKLIGRF